MSEEINVKIGAQITGLLNGLEQSQAAVAASVGEMKASMASLGEAAAAIQAPFLALSGILAGGAIFKEAIGGTIEWTNDIVGLSKRLGITTEDASGLKVALDHLGISSDEYGGIVSKMTRQMRTNEQAFDRMGIRTKDSNGEWRNSQAIMTAVIDRLSGMKAGTDRNVAAQALLGGRVGDVTNILRLTSAMIAESTEKAEKFHLIVGPDGEQKMLRYKSGMADLRLIGESLKVQIGDALIPVLTDVGAWFGEHGPTMAKIFGEAIKTVRAILTEFKGDLSKMVDSWQGFVSQVQIGDDALSQAWDKMAKRDFAGARDALVAGWRDIGREGDLVTLALAEDAKVAAAELAKITNPAVSTKSKAPTGTTTEGSDLGKDNGDAARQKEWEAAQAGYKLREAQAHDNEQEIINIKAAAVGKALQIFGAGTKEYLAAETDLQNALNAADDKATKTRLELQKKASEETRRAWETVLNGLANSIQQSLAGMLQGTVTMAQAIKNLMKTVISEFVSMNVKTLIAHIANEKAKTAATAEGTAEREGLDEWAATKSVAIHAWQTITEIGHDAVAGAAAAFKSIAAIPIIGPALAPAAAAAAGVAILGFAGHVASAEGGYDIPRGINPMTQLHQSEMVLPAELANKVRAMTDAGPGGPVHFHITAIDRKGVRQFFDEHGDHIVRVLQGKERNFQFGQ